MIVSTGAGSTGWYRSILTGAAGIVQALCARSPEVRGRPRPLSRSTGSTRRLVFNVREPFVSKTSGAEIVHGTITEDSPWRSSRTCRRTA